MKPITTILLIIAFVFAAAFQVSAADGPDRTAKKFFKKGLKAYEKADSEDARQNLEKAIENYPDYAEAYFLLGRISLSEKKVQQAFGYFSKAVEINPGHKAAQLELSRILMAARMPEEALVHADAALKTDAGNLNALLVKSSALMAQKRPADAIALLSPLFEKGERSRELILLLAGAHFRQTETALGKSVLKAGLDAHPEDVALHLQLAGAYHRTGDLKAAQTAMQTIMGINPKNPAYPIALARLYWESGENAQADQTLQRALKADPADPARRIAVANAYLEKNQVDRAEGLLRQGIEAVDSGARLRLALGELYLNTARPQEAVDLLKQGLEKTPESDSAQRIDLHNALAGIYLSARDNATAKTYAQAVLDKDPVNIQALITRGMTLKADGQADAAISDFKQVLRRKPDFLQGYIQLADGYVINRQTEQARATLTTGLQLAPDNRDLLMAMYRVCLMEKDYKQAETHLRALVEKYPDAIEAQARLGDFYLSLNDESAARREYSEIVLKAPRSAVGHIKLARLYARQGKKESAVAQLQKGIALVEQNQALAAELTTLFLDDGRFEDALALCDERLSKDPDEAFAHNLKGMTFTKMKAYKKAQHTFEKAVELDPMWPEAGNNLAAVFLLQGKKDQAMAHFEATLARNPKNPTATLALGRLHEERSETTKAIAVYEKGVAQVPGFWSAANRLAFLLADQATSLETLDRALRLATAAYQLKPGQASIVDTLGWIHYKKGETRQAIQLYEQLLSAAPDSPVANYHMGVVLKKSGDTESARQRLQTATATDAPFVGRDHAEALLKEMKSNS